MDFKGANLQGQSFKGKNLSDINFTGANIQGTNFTGAVLKGAVFDQAKCGVHKHWYVTSLAISFLLSALATCYSNFMISRLANLTGVSDDLLTISSSLLTVIGLLAFFISTFYKNLVFGVIVSISTIPFFIPATLLGIWFFELFIKNDILQFSTPASIIPYVSNASIAILGFISAFITLCFSISLCVCIFSFFLVFLLYYSI